MEAALALRIALTWGAVEVQAGEAISRKGAAAPGWQRLWSAPPGCRWPRPMKVQMTAGQMMAHSRSLCGHRTRVAEKEPKLLWQLVGA